MKVIVAKSVEKEKDLKLHYSLSFAEKLYPKAADFH